jgi:long-chain fatty acid transport protein
VSRRIYRAFYTIRLSHMVPVTALVLGLCAPAYASIFDTYGFGSRGTAMGNALTAAAEDYHAVYYNPAQLMLRDHVHVGAGFSYVQPWLTIDREFAGSTVPSVLPARNAGFTLGVSTPLGGVFKNRVAFGFGIFLPLLRMTRAETIDYAIPQFTMYENLPDKLIVLLGGAVRIMPWLDIGAGMQILANLEGKAEVRLNLVDQRVDRRRMSIDLFGEISWTAGITVRPMDGLSFGVSFRESLDLKYSQPVKALLDGLGFLEFDIDGTGLYTPHQLSFGTSWTLPWAPLTIVADITWAMWSLAPSPAPNTYVSLDTSGLTDRADAPKLIDVTSTAAPLNAVDIVIPRLGLEYKVTEAVVLRSGYWYRPTPIPTQIHQTNYVDSDAHIVSLGGAWTFRDPTRVHKKPLTVGLSLQMTVLRERRYQKVNPQDETGSYTARGTIFCVGIDIQHDF